MALATTGPAAVPQAVLTAEGDQRPLLAARPVAAASAPRGIEARVVVGSVLAILLGLVVGAVLNEAANPPALTVPAGISVFALFYVITQGLERLLEPFASYLDSTSRDHAEVRDEALATAMTMHATGNPAGATDQLKTAAQHQEAIQQQRTHRTVIYWAAASILGTLLSGILGLYLLHVVGLQDDLVGTDGRLTGSWWSAAGVRHTLDLLVTGLAIGGGTKPLHDLIKNLQEAKNDKKDPAQVR